MRKVLSVIAGTLLLFSSCNKEEKATVPVKSKYEYGYSSLAECMDSLNVKPGITYRYRAYHGLPDANPANDSGTVVFSLDDTTVYHQGGQFTGKFKFYMPDFDQSRGNRNIRFSSVSTSNAVLYPFAGPSGYQVIYSADTYLWENSSNTYKYTPDTTKFIQAGQNSFYSVFLYR